MEEILHILKSGAWDGLGVIISALAVIVALCANRKTTKQMQQTIDLQLMDPRIDMLEALRERRDVSFLKMKVLFSEDICDIYYQWEEYKRNHESAQHEENEFFSWWVNHGDDSVQATIYEYECKMADEDYPENVETEYNQYCEKKIVEDWIKEESGERWLSRSLDYREIQRKIEENNEKEIEAREKLFKEMEKYITDSISLPRNK